MSELASELGCGVRVRAVDGGAGDGCSADSVDGWYGCHVARTETLAAVDALTEAGDCWQRAYRTWQQAVEHRDRVISRSERRVVRAAGGLVVRQWEAASRRRHINTRAEASIVARAVRARPEVRMAVEEADRRRAREDEAILAARLKLADATKRVLGYGGIGRQLTGLTSAELHQLARSRLRVPVSRWTEARRCAGTLGVRWRPRGAHRRELPVVEHAGRQAERPDGGVHRGEAALGIDEGRLLVRGGGHISRRLSATGSVSAHPSHAFWWCGSPRSDVAAGDDYGVCCASGA